MSEVVDVEKTVAHYREGVRRACAIYAGEAKKHKGSVRAYYRALANSEDAACAIERWVREQQNGGISPEEMMRAMIGLMSGSLAHVFCENLGADFIAMAARMFVQQLGTTAAVADDAGPITSDVHMEPGGRA